MAPPSGRRHHGVMRGCGERESSLLASGSAFRRLHHPGDRRSAPRPVCGPRLGPLGLPAASGPAAPAENRGPSFLAYPWLAFPPIVPRLRGRLPPQPAAPRPGASEAGSVGPFVTRAGVIRFHVTYGMSRMYVTYIRCHGSFLGVGVTASGGGTASQY